MQFTGTSSVALPQVSSFGFNFTGVRVSSTGSINFMFSDTGTGVFTFSFSGGLLSLNTPICTYNTVDYTNISGYYQSGIVSYLVNGIFGQQNISFSKLNQLTINAGTSSVICDLFINSNPINYSVTFSPNYSCFGNLTGTIISDTVFNISNPSFLFYNSNQNLLLNSYTGITISSGINTLTFPDIDPSFFEYQNDFSVTLPTTFGNIGGGFSSYRSGIISQSVMTLAGMNSNVYAETSLFDGQWSGSKFIYVDNPTTYNLGFNYGNYSYFGLANTSTLNITFQPLKPANGSGYTAQYITGFNLISGGKYSLPPIAQFSQYYYVTGLQNSSQSFLFSTGCTGSIPVTFTGSFAISGASGAIFLKPVYLSGIYNTGIANFNIWSGYSGTTSGLGYQGVPVFVLNTGGGCYSVPDHSGVQTAQFKFATGYGAVYAQAAGLTGLALMSGGPYWSSVTGIQLTNIGFGYSTGFSPNVTFARQNGDFFATGDYYVSGGNVILSGGYPIIISGNSTGNLATGNFSYKSTGLYQFDQFWDIDYNFGTGFVGLPDFGGYFSGSVGAYGGGNVGLQITCSGLDNTSAVSGLLTLSLVGSGGYPTKTNQQIIFQSRTFDLSTGSMLVNPSAVITFVPLPDLGYLSLNDPYDIYYQGLYNGGTVDNIINF